MLSMGVNARNKVSTAINLLDAWIEKEKYQGWDPHDALNSPILKTLSFENRLAGIIWVQLLKRLPVNLRPLLRVPKGYNTKGMGLFLSSYLRKFQMTGDKTYLEKVDFFSQWLRVNISPGYSGACWGYNFDWPNRGFFALEGTPTIVNTTFIGLAFLDAYRVTGDEGALSVARSTCDFILKDLNVLRAGEEENCFSYTPLDERYIHNANLKGAELLAGVYTVTREPELHDTALAATRYTVRRQTPNGIWRYGEDKKERWVDNIHTGFVLVSLKMIKQYLDLAEIDEAIEKGYEFWKENFFLPDAVPKYYSKKVFPIDAHCVAQAILTYLEYRDFDHEANSLAWRMAKWGIDNLQDSQGYFQYQIYPRYRIKIPYIRWSQAWMQRALTELVYRDNTAAL